MTVLQAPRQCRGGRPPAHEAEVRRQYLIDVAAHLFQSKGYEATSMERIAREAGASKATIYRHFGDKATLFHTVFNSFVAPLWPELDTIPTLGRSPAEVLSAYGTVLLSSVTPSSIALLRMIYRESQNFPELTRVYDEIEHMSIGVVADYLSSAVRGNLLDLADPPWAARQFLDLVFGTLVRRLILSTQELPSEAERRRIIESAVALFLDGCRSRRHQPEPS